jgi:hypothetical protein
MMLVSLALSNTLEECVNRLVVNLLRKRQRKDVVVSSESCYNTKYLCVRCARQANKGKWIWQRKRPNRILWRAAVALELTVRLIRRYFSRSIMKYSLKLCVSIISNILWEILDYYYSTLKSCFQSWKGLVLLLLQISRILVLQLLKALLLLLSIL